MTRVRSGHLAQERAEARDTAVEHDPRPLDATHGAVEFTFRAPFFRTDEAAAYLGYRGPHALRSLYRFIKAKGIKTARRNRTLLIAKRDLDEAIGAGHRRVS